VRVGLLCLVDFPQDWQVIRLAARFTRKSLWGIPLDYSEKPVASVIRSLWNARRQPCEGFGTFAGANGIMDQPLELLLIRHGESQFNLDGSGGFDSALTELGRAQALKLAPWLATNFNITLFYASTMVRARETAEIVQSAIKLPIQFRENLREADFEIGETMPRFLHPVNAIGGLAVELDDTDPTYAAFQARVSQAYHDIVNARAAGTVLIVTHGGVIATLVRTIFGAHRVSVHADNTSATLLRWSNARWYLVYSNRVDHLNGK
jgi:broad specificity phosphatase PhoE